MARNAEKSMAVLNRWLSIKQNIAKGATVRRPRDVNECTQLNEAEKWRGQVVREISRKISDIQNASLGEHVIRDLNDQINRLLKEKYKWEIRITELGGCDYRSQQSTSSSSSSSTSLFDSMGIELSSQSGYKYFGAAKDLPGVRELFYRESSTQPKRTRQQLYQFITPDYYGWRDEDDVDLIKAEKEKEDENLRGEREEFEEEMNDKMKKFKKALELSETHANPMEEEEEGEGASSSSSSASASATTHDLTAVEDIRRLIAQKKKQALLDVYTSSQQQKEESEARELAGLQTPN